MHGGDGLDCVVKAVSFLAAVAEDFPVLHAGEGVLDAGADASVFGVVLLLAAQEWASGSSVVRDDQSGAQVGAVRDDRAVMAGRSDSRQAWASALFPGTGRAEAIIRRLSASMMTCTFAENR